MKIEVLSVETTATNVMVVQFVFQPAYGNIIKSVYKITNTVLYEIKKNIEFFEYFAFDKLSEWIGTVTLLNKLLTIIREWSIVTHECHFHIHKMMLWDDGTVEEMLHRCLECLGGGGGIWSEQNDEYRTIVANALMFRLRKTTKQFNARHGTALEHFVLWFQNGVQ